MKTNDFFEKFESRHNGPRVSEIQEMLKVVGVNSLDELMNETIPENIRLDKDLDIGIPLAEFEFLNKLRQISKKNKIYHSFIGMGYYSTIVPSVIQRNILENPGWYTQYTPYQAEISQGRLEALLNFQTMVSDLTGLPIANASLLDEATAAAEAMLMLKAQRTGSKKNANIVLVSDEVLPQTIDVLKTRAYPHNLKIQIECHNQFRYQDDVFAIVLQYPAVRGSVYDYRELIKKAKENNIFVIIAADLMSLALLVPPGELGADVAVGSTQRFGVPMGYGGPHAAYFATKDEFKRVIPGRIIGVSVDMNNERALRMALQTREQHIRREKATSNICTSQVLLAIMAGMYAIYHGPEGIKKIANRIHYFTCLLNNGLQKLGYKQINKFFFDTLQIDFNDNPDKIEIIEQYALEEKLNFNYFFDKKILISIDEKTTLENLLSILRVFARANSIEFKYELEQTEVNSALPSDLIRTSKYLTHSVFNSYHSEHEMLRYIKRLEMKDLSLTTSMIPLGSCTMKLNAATEMFGVSWPEFAELHPFAPAYQAEGYKELISELEKDLCKITGFDAVSMQPNSGAQGEYTGLMVMRSYFKDRGEERNIILIPASAHGTNPASAVMAGYNVLVVNCDLKGNIDISDLEKKAEMHKNNLAGIMVTYPSTHGVFEENIVRICEIIHNNGGLVYMDGANMNAQVGLTSPKKIGADLCHLNLHKTFSIPHGGGGPGMGPIAVAKHLVPYLPSHPIVDISREKSMTAVSAAPWGSAGILMISYGYIKMMGSEGLKNATKIAILNANYIKSRLEKYYKVLYVGEKGRVAHEMIFDMREFKNSAGIEVEDIAKRLMDYGFHAPTVSFPVPGTLMIEPTESESKFELDRFCDAMISIRNEIQEIIDNKYDKTNNVLKNAPHTARMVASDEWKFSYTREKAAYPCDWCKQFKFWPAVARVNNAYGDRNLVCTCEPIESYINN